MSTLREKLEALEKEKAELEAKLKADDKEELGDTVEVPREDMGGVLDANQEVQGLHQQLSQLLYQFETRKRKLNKSIDEAEETLRHEVKVLADRMSIPNSEYSLQLTEGEGPGLFIRNKEDEDADQRVPAKG